MTAPTSCRGILAGSVAALTCGTAVAAAASPDARLLALCSEFLASSAIINAIEQPYFDRDEDIPDGVFEHLREMTPRRLELRSAIAGCPATTVSGVLEKARVLFDDTSDGPNAPPLYSDEAHIAWSLARDVLALNGGTA